MTLQHNTHTHRYHYATVQGEFSLQLVLEVSHWKGDSQKRPLERLAFVQNEKNSKIQSSNKRLNTDTAEAVTEVLLSFIFVELSRCDDFSFYSGTPATMI